LLSVPSGAEGATQTGEELVIFGRKVLTFVAARAMKKAVNSVSSA